MDPPGLLTLRHHDAARVPAPQNRSVEDVETPVTFPQVLHVVGKGQRQEAELFDAVIRRQPLNFMGQDERTFPLSAGQLFDRFWAVPGKPSI